MGILRNIDGITPFCLCFPPIWFTVNPGTVWQCDNCGRIYLRQTEKPVWRKITEAEWENMR